MMDSSLVQNLDTDNVSSKRRNPVIADIYNMPVEYGEMLNEERHIKAYYSGKIGIWDKKPAFEEVKTGIHDKKPAFEVLITELKLSKSTRNNIEKLHTAFTEGTAFGRNDMRELTGLGESATSDLIKKMLKYGLIEKAEGRGKYRFTL